MRERSASKRTEPYVPCECCEVEIPVRRAHMLRAGGFICDGCYRELSALNPAKNDSEREDDR